MTDNGGFYKDLLDNLFDGVYFVDRDRRITYWNKGSERITGFKAEEVVGHCCSDNILMHVDKAGTNLCKTACPLSFAMEDGQLHEADVYLHHKDGHRVPVIVRASPISDNSGKIIGAVEIFSDNTAMENMEKQMGYLETLSMRDELTGFGNRRLAEMVLSSKLSETARYGIPFGVLFIDLDLFKNINDSHGHVMGDKVLKMVAKTLSLVVRTSDYVCRWGGEEFLVILSHTTDDELLSTANRLRVLVEMSSITTFGASINTTISVGATKGAPGDTVESLVKRADDLMFLSKRLGRNRVNVG